MNFLANSLKTSYQKVFRVSWVSGVSCVKTSTPVFCLSTRLITFARPQNVQITTTCRTFCAQKNNGSVNGEEPQESMTIVKEAGKGLMGNATKAGEDLAQYATDTYKGIMSKEPVTGAMNDGKEAVVATVKAGGKIVHDSRVKLAEIIKPSA